MKAFQYTGPAVEEVWAEALPLVELGLATGYGEKSGQDLFNDIVKGLSQLFLWRDGGKIKFVMVTSFVDHPQYKVLFVESVAGRGGISLLREYWDVICTWARANGAVTLEAATQPGVTRLLRQLGARKVYDVVRYSLERPNVWS